MNDENYKEINILDVDQQRTAFYQKHVEAGADIVEFAGWMMPMSYTSIKEEHVNVREKGGLFDISHMGEFEVVGADAFSYLQRMIANDLSKIKSGHVLYTPCCNSGGNIIDDMLVYRFSKEHFMLVVNASQTHKDYQWLAENIDSSEDVKVVNISDGVQALALQGPISEYIMSSFFTETDFNDFYYGSFRNISLNNKNYLVSRTGYTGEDGFEIYGEDIVSLWDKFFEIGAEKGLKPAGLGCRDTLRLEMGYSLYGHELNERRNPFQSGIGWTVAMNKKYFIGREAIAAKEHTEGSLIGFEFVKRGIPRADCDILKDGAMIGKVTSGTFSPTLNKGIGLGFVSRKDLVEGDIVDIVIREKSYSAKIVKTPFYKEKKLKRRQYKNV